jgi:Arc/MetJ family transcription regulator
MKTTTRTTMILNDALVAEAMRVTGIDRKTAVVEAGLRALIEKAARERLAALAGSLPEATAPPRRREEAEVERSRS